MAVSWKLKYLIQKDMGLLYVMQKNFVDWTCRAREMSSIHDLVFKPLNWIDIEPDKAKDPKT